MKADTYIISSFNAEVRKQEEQRKLSKQQRYKALKEFKESICDLFDMTDFCYYAELIGCKVSYLLNIAKYSSDAEYKKYIKPARNLQSRRQFYIDNGHSITKPFQWN